MKNVVFFSSGDQEKADKIILYLKNIINSESPIHDSNFQSWVKNSNFNIQNIAGAEVLYKRQKENNNNRTRSEINAKENIPVAIKENFLKNKDRRWWYRVKTINRCSNWKNYWQKIH